MNEGNAKKIRVMKETMSVIACFAAALIAAICIRMFVFELVRVDGNSMKPTLYDGQTLFVEKKIPEKEEINRKVHNLLFQNFSDCDKITNVPRVRTRRAGDVFRPAGRGVTKSVKKILNELRIPAAARDRLLLLEKDGEIIWIEAVGAAEGYAAKPNFPALELTVTDTAGITRI